jgi:hypothetical protein
MRLIVMTSPEELMPDSKWKNTLNYIVTANAIIQLFRMMSFFLLIESLSKMILTFINMIIDTLPFIFLLGSYMVAMCSVFTSLFQDINPSLFMDFMTTFGTLFNGMMAAYAHVGAGKDEKMFSIFMLVHVICANVLMLNYLVAILSKTYENLL